MCRAEQTCCLHVDAMPQFAHIIAHYSMLAECQTVEDATRISTEGHAVMNEIEMNSKPIVAAIMGSCLGGGLEVSQQLRSFVCVGGDSRTLRDDCTVGYRNHSAGKNQNSGRDGREYSEIDALQPCAANFTRTCLQVAASCAARIAVNDKNTILQSPEVMLGIIPGAGGTQRIPMLVRILLMLRD